MTEPVTPPLPRDVVSVLTGLGKFAKVLLPFSMGLKLRIGLERDFEAASAADGLFRPAYNTNSVLQTLVIVPGDRISQCRGVVRIPLNH